jgi:hypothetical protein
MSLCQVLWRNCYSSGANVFQQYLETLAEKSRLQAELPREVILKNIQKLCFFVTDSGDEIINTVRHWQV